MSVGAAAVDADALVDDALAHQLLGQRAVGGRQISFSRPSKSASELLADQGLDPVDLGLALLLARDGERRASSKRTAPSTASQGVVLVVEEDRELAGLLGGDLRPARPAPRTAP